MQQASYSHSRRHFAVENVLLLSRLSRNPISTSIVFAVIGVLTVLDATNAGDTNFLDASMQEQALTLLGSLVGAGLELKFFARVMVQVLL